MLKSLFPQIDWDAIKAVGFDLDGTLYDELDFIHQVYQPISEKLARVCGHEAPLLFEELLSRWIEKGSSYNRIYDEVLVRYQVPSAIRNSVIEECLQIYREHQPSLKISHRVRALLDYFKQYYSLFLITDGRKTLQRRKIQALQLNKWFSSDGITVSGEFGADAHKPSTRMLEALEVWERYAPQEIVYFGDRPRDKEMAERAGIHFIAVHNMYPSYLINR